MLDQELKLSQARQEKGITLEEIHRESKIPIRLLKAIEELRFDELPEPPFARNLIKSYGRYTGINPAPILELYNQYSTISSRREEKLPEEIQSASEGKSNRPLWTTGVIVFVTLFAAVLFYLLTDRPPQVPPIPPQTPVQKESMSPTPEPPQETKSALRLRIEAREPTWIRIKVDDEPPTEITLRAGEVIEHTAYASIHLDIGNAGGTEVKFQGKSLGKLGERGEVVHLKFP